MANIHLQSNIFSEGGFPQSAFCDWVQKALAIFIHLWRSRTILNEIDFATELFLTKISRTFCTQSQKVLYGRGNSKHFLPPIYGGKKLNLIFARFPFKKKIKEKFKIDN